MDFRLESAGPAAKAKIATDVEYLYSQLNILCQN